MALYSLYCAAVPLRNCSLTHSRDRWLYWLVFSQFMVSCHPKILWANCITDINLQLIIQQQLAYFVTCSIFLSHWNSAASSLSAANLLFHFKFSDNLNMMSPWALILRYHDTRRFSDFVEKLLHCWVLRNIKHFVMCATGVDPGLWWCHYTVHDLVSLHHDLQEDVKCQPMVWYPKILLTNCNMFLPI